MLIPRGGGRGYLTKFNTGRLYPGVGVVDVGCGLINGEGTPRCW